MAAFGVAFLGSGALWWTYFARSAHDASETIAHSEDPGRIARSAYTYFHLPMIAGIIAVAAADELTVAHPGDPGTFASISLTLGGTALFVVGHGRLPVGSLRSGALVPLGGCRRPGCAGTGGLCGVGALPSRRSNLDRSTGRDQ